MSHDLLLFNWIERIWKMVRIRLLWGRLTTIQKTSKCAVKTKRPQFETTPRVNIIRTDAPITAFAQSSRSHDMFLRFQPKRDGTKNSEILIVINEKLSIYLISEKWECSFSFVFWRLVGADCPDVIGGVARGIILNEAEFYFCEIYVIPNFDPFYCDFTYPKFILFL